MCIFHYGCRGANWLLKPLYHNKLRPEQNGRHFPDDIFKWTFLNENLWISLKVSPKFVPKGPINNMPALVQIMAWRRPDDKPLSELMMVSLLTHICVAWPQWVYSTVFVYFMIFSAALQFWMAPPPRKDYVLGPLVSTWINFHPSVNK